ncbi:MAG: hypothetical protein Q7J35_04730 [Candidatus Methanoperedens sp.]|nr:hypothetical protein [Candidatus Methanoperedens sp.]
MSNKELLSNKDGISEVVGAILILFIIMVYVGMIQTYEVPKWNKEIERQIFDEAYSDFIAFRSDIEDVSTRNIPKKSSVHMGIRYPERFMLQSPGPGAYGIITSYPLNINLSYSGKGYTKWKNYSSIGIVYEMKGLSEQPKLVYENGLIIKDLGKYSFSIDERQPLTSEDNIFIHVLRGSIDSSSSIEPKIFDIQPVPLTSNNNVRFSSVNLTIETKYPEIWKRLSNKSRPPGSNFTIESNCSPGIGCIKITNIQGYYLRRLNMPGDLSDQFSQDQMTVGMISIDNAMTGTRGPTGPDGQDMWEKNQGRLDIPPASSATQFILRDITIDDDEEKTNKITFSVTDTKDHLWTIEIKFKKIVNGKLLIESVKQKSPQGADNAGLDVVDGKYNAFTNSDITLSREIDLTPYYRQLSNIGLPNILTIDKIDPEILYVNFLIN